MHARQRRRHARSADRWRRCPDGHRPDGSIPGARSSRRHRRPASTSSRMPDLEVRATCHRSSSIRWSSSPSACATTASTCRTRVPMAASASGSVASQATMSKGRPSGRGASISAAKGSTPRKPARNRLAGLRPGQRQRTIDEQRKHRAMSGPIERPSPTSAPDAPEAPEGPRHRGRAILVAVGLVGAIAVGAIAIAGADEPTGSADPAASPTTPPATATVERRSMAVTRRPDGHARLRRRDVARRQPPRHLDQGGHGR